MDDNEASRRQWLIGLRPRLVPGLFLFIGLLLTVLLAVQSFTDSPPTAAETTLWISLATLCQVGGGLVFGRVGRVERNHVRSAVRRLLRAGFTVKRCRELLEGVEGSEVANEALIALQFSIGDSIEDWNDVHGDALREVLRDQTNIVNPEEPGRG